MRIIWDQNTEGGAAALSAEDNATRAVEIDQVIEEVLDEPEPAKPTLKGFGLGQR